MGVGVQSQRISDLPSEVVLDLNTTSEVHYRDIDDWQLQEAIDSLQDGIGEMVYCHYNNILQFDQDTLICTLLDLLPYKDYKLIQSTLDLLNNHFNKFQNVLENLKSSYLLFTPDETMLMSHISFLKSILVDITSQIFLSENQINILLKVLKKPKLEQTKQGLIDICYASEYDFQCSVCGKWYKGKNAEQEAQGCDI